MKQSLKAAWVAFAIILTLTAVKFILYWISGSIAVLSEAWHSFADITTTFFVLISIYRQEKKVRSKDHISPSKTESGSAEDLKKEKLKLSVFSRVYTWFRTINSELKISIVIGSVLTGVAISIFFKAITSKPESVSSALVTGLVFIGLSFASYFLYRFEAAMGKTEQSAALTADSQHNKADMAISLLTGISLVLYHFGINLDQWMGIVTAIFILTFSIELLVNTVRSIYYGHQDVVFSHRFSSILYAMFDGAIYSRLYRFIDRYIRLGTRVERAIRFIPVAFRFLTRWTFRLGVCCLVLWYGSTMVYSVDTGEQALKFRFGRLVNKEKAVLPGLHFKLPFPVDSVIRISTDRIETLTVGNAAKDDVAMIWSQDHGDNQTFIAGDNNLFLPFVVIHYRIKSIHEYVLNHRNGTPEKLLEATAYRLLNQVFTQMSFYDLILDQREEWTARFEDLLQLELNYQSSGIKIVAFCLKDLHPPIQLASAYEDVVAANLLKETYLNDAQRKVNSLLSRERNNAMTTIRKAQTYVSEKKNIAVGEAQNYLLRYSGYAEGGQTMKDLLKLKAAEKTLKNKKIYIVDPKSGIDQQMIYIENFVTGRRD